MISKNNFGLPLTIFIPIFVLNTLFVDLSQANDPEKIFLPEQKHFELIVQALSETFNETQPSDLGSNSKDGDQIDIKFDLNREIERAAFEAAKNQLVNSAIEKMVTYGLSYTPAMVAALNQINSNPDMTAGAKVLLIYSSMKSMDTLVNSDSDKEKAYATADLATSYLIATAPPAGAIAAIALTSVKIIDQVLSTQSQSEIFKIQEEIIKLKSQIFKDESRLLRAEIIPILFQLNLLNRVITEVAKLERETQKNCEKAAKKSQINELNLCMDSLNQYFYFKSLSGNIMINLSSVSVQNEIASELLLVNYGFDQMKLNQQGLKTLKEVKDLRGFFSKIYRDYEKLQVAHLYKPSKSIERSGLVRPCVKKMQKLLFDSYDFKLRRDQKKYLTPASNDKEELKKESLKKQLLLTEYNEIFFGQCFEFLLEVEPDTQGTSLLLESVKKLKSQLILTREDIENNK